MSVSGSLPVIAAAREACAACPYYSVCPLAPLFLQVEAPRGGRKPHPHGRTLEMYLQRLKRTSPRTYERDLLAAMGGDDEGLALVAGCLLATDCWEEPDKLRRLVETMHARMARAGPARALAPLEEQIQRAAAIAQDPEVPRLLRAPVRLRRPERELTAAEAVRLATRLIAGETPALWWNEAVAPADRPAFEASFALRDKTRLEGGAGGGVLPPGDESQSGGPGSLDVFFSARAGGRSAVFYYRRDASSGKHALVPAEAVRADSLLKRMVKVFDTDAKKTHRLFAKLCRALNNGYRQLDKRMLWEGLKALDREQLVVIALYAPRLARFVEKRAKFPGLYRLVKFLHVNTADDENGIPAHVKVFERRAQVGAIIETYGKEPFMDLCRAVFRIAEAYRPGPQSADLIFKIGEVAYLLTAVQGFNLRGLEVSVAGRNPLAFVAYGLQPPVQREGAVAWRYRRLVEAKARIESAAAPPNGGGPGGDGADSDRRALLVAIDQGLQYMAAVHGFPDVEALARAASGAPHFASVRPEPGGERSEPRESKGAGGRKS